MILGNDIIVTTNIDGQQAAIAACKTCKFNIRQNFIQACSPTSGRVKKKIPADYEWGVSCDCLVADPRYIKKWIDATKGGTELTLQFLMGGGFKVVGKAFVGGCDTNAPKNGLTTFSVQFEGSEGIDTDQSGWDFINGTLYTYGNFADGTLTLDGTLTDGTMEKNSNNN